MDAGQLSTVNYNHLRYFWTVARLDSVTAAARVLHLTQPTVSAQLRQFEKTVGSPLFIGEGRDRHLSDVGRLLFRFAEEVFSLEREMHDTLAGLPTDRARPFRVGVTDGIPKLLVQQFLEPVLAMEAAPTLVLREGPQETLLEALHDHALDLVLLDAPATGKSAGRAKSLELGESEVMLFGNAELAARYREGYPHSLNGAPLLMPAPGTVVRQLLDSWLAVEGVQPKTVAEMDDSALLKALGMAGHGLFALPVAVADDVRAKYGMEIVGDVGGGRVRYYAITMERRLEADTARAIAEIARHVLKR